MDQHRTKQLLHWAGYAAAGALALALLPLVLPVALGILGAAALDPLIRRLQKRTGMGRGGSSVLCVCAALGALGALVFGLGRILLGELVALSGQLPALLETAAGWASALSGRLEALSQRLPDGAGDAVRAWAQGIVSGSGALAQRLYEAIFSLVSRLLTALPGSLFFLLTAVLSCCFAACELPRLRELAALRLPKAMAGRAARAAEGLRTALGGWARAQVRLMGVTFAVLAVGLLVLGVSSPLLLALGISILDALPLLGVGTVLLPWAAGAMLGGRMGLGLGLLGLYGLAALLRNVLEPRFLGAQFGVSPLLTLAAIYAGWRVGGFWGMLLLPMAALAGSQLWAGASAPAREPDRSRPLKYSRNITENR